MEYRMVCDGCGRTYGAEYPGQVCGKCAGNLRVAYPKKRPRVRSDGSDFWDYEPVLPSSSYGHTELGGTKLITGHGLNGVYLKLEIENPTRSFKDRGSVVELAKAKEYGYRSIVCASTGNMAYSLSYYAKLEGMRAKVFIGGNPNKDKLRDIKETGDADLVLVNGDFNKALSLAYKFSTRNKAFLTGDYCYRKEGQKTVAYEIMDQLPGATHIIVPVGNATLLSGVFSALSEMREAGRLRRYPKLVAVQAARCSPLVKAFNNSRPVHYEVPRTGADAIAVGYPTFGEEGIRALRQTGGTGITVTENEMKSEQKRFLQEYGLVAETAGVASLAAARKLGLTSRDKAVAIISGGNV